MKTLRTIFVFLVISLAAGYGVYSVNSDTIISTRADMAGEIGVIAIPVFIFLIFIYMVAKAVGKAVKKKPSAEQKV